MHWAHSHELQGSVMLNYYYIKLLLYYNTEGLRLHKAKFWMKMNCVFLSNFHRWRTKWQSCRSHCPTGMCKVCVCYVMRINDASWFFLCPWSWCCLCVLCRAGTWQSSYAGRCVARAVWCSVRQRSRGCGGCGLGSPLSSSPVTHPVSSEAAVILSFTMEWPDRVQMEYDKAALPRLFKNWRYTGYVFLSNRNCHVVVSPYPSKH